MRRKCCHIDVVTLFPTLFESPLKESIIRIAQEKKAVAIKIHNLRDYTHDRRKTCDGIPFGGGPGMIMRPEPIFECIEALKKKRPQSKVIFMTPQGKRLTQKKLHTLSRRKGFIILCGHYEGIDERVRETLVDEEISLGDYVLTGGELPALCLIDGIVRLIPGVLRNPESHKYESFQKTLFDHPHYTRPRTYRGMDVPEVLRTGNHKAINEWRAHAATKKTRAIRPDILTEKPTRKHVKKKR